MLTLTPTLALPPAMGAQPGPAAAADGEGGTVRLCVDPDWAPYEWLDEQGRHRGIAADLTRLIAERAGLRLSIVPSANWDESLSLARTGKCDALSFLNQTPEREGWLSFTRPYFFDRNVIITRAEHPDVTSLAALPAGTAIALPTATSIIEQVGRDFPALRILPVASETEAFAMVEQREAELTLRALTVAAHTIRTEGWFNLRIAGEVPAYANRMRIGIVGQRPALLAGLDAAIASLTPEQVDEIVNRHVAIEVPAGIDRSLIARISAGFAVMLLLAYLWIRHLRGVNQRLAALGRQMGEDIAARQRAEHALKESEERYRSLVELAHESILVVQDGRVVYCNPAFHELVGRTPDELEKIDAIGGLIHPDDQQRARDNHDRRIAGETAEQRYPLRLVHKSGRLLWAETSGVPISWNDRPATLNIVNDITARTEAEERIKHLAQHDALTGLPNRALLSDRLERALAAAQRNGYVLGVLFIDLDGFKPVNDRHGHDVGDALLQAVAQRLQGLVRESDTAARIGGDEFVVLLPTIAGAEDADRVASKLRAALASPFDIHGHRIMISGSIGVALFPRDGDNAPGLMQRADSAMYRDKHATHPH
ncbi:MAG: diguanylate cyclase domain-containing protein [Thauera sp.]